jgi:hypothetical protein
VAKKRERVREDQLRNWNLLDQFRRRVLPLLQAQAATATEQDERRTLFAGDYFCSYLFAMLNPVITSLRSLGHVSHCQKMRGVSAAPFSPAAFSEGQHLFNPAILEEVVRQLAQENQGRGWRRPGAPGSGRADGGGRHGAAGGAAHGLGPGGRPGHRH